MQNYNALNCYQILAIDKDASSEEIKHSARLSEADISVLPRSGAAHFLRSANELGILLIMRETAVEILSDPFRRKVYDWDLAAYEEWNAEVPGIYGAVRLHPLHWVGGSWNEKDGSWHLPNVMDIKIRDINYARKLDDKFESGSNVLDKRDFQHAANFSTGTSPESNSAYWYLTAKMLARDPSMARESSSVDAYKSPFWKIVSRLSREPALHPSARKLFKVWLDNVEQNYISAESLKRSMDSLFEALTANYGLNEFTEGSRNGRFDLLQTLIKKWPSLVTDGFLKGVEQYQRYHAPNDRHIRNLRTIAEAARNDGPG